VAKVSLAVRMERLQRYGIVDTSKIECGAVICPRHPLGHRYPGKKCLNPRCADAHVP
jgi:hypothetical protein